MKRVFSLLLILTILLSMIVLPISAADPVEKSPEQLATMQRAIIETALAYYRKGTNIIYDPATMSVQDRRSVGISHVSSDDAPELAADDNILYTSCAEFCHNVYVNAFGYAPAGDARHAFVRYLNYYKSTSDAMHFCLSEFVTYKHDDPKYGLRKVFAYADETPAASPSSAEPSVSPASPSPGTP